MKTSNKLLIILAAALFVVPLVSMIIYAKNTRVDGLQYETGLKNEGENPDAADHFLTSRKVGNFSAITIDGNGNLYVNISIIKADKPLIKFSEANDDFFTTSVDDSGTLHIGKKSEEKFSTASIFVFTPNIDSISLNKLQVAKFETDFDSIKMEASNINNAISFGENKNLKTLDLTIRNSRFNIGSPHNTASYLRGLQHFNIHIIDGAVSLKRASYKALALNLENSRFNFIQQRDGDNGVKASVQSLIVNTLGNSELSLSEDVLEFGNIKGSLSDSTTTDLPIYIVKDLF